MIISQQTYGLYKYDYECVYDWLIDFNDISTHLGLFYALRLDLIDCWLIGFYDISTFVDYLM